MSLKCLHRLRRRTIKGHNSHELFFKLGRSDRRKIAVYLLEIVRQHPNYLEFFSYGVKFDVDSVLQRASDMFTKARYWHELELPSADNQGHSSNAGIGSLTDAIARLILELRPEWKDKIANFRFIVPRTGTLPT